MPLPHQLWSLVSRFLVQSPVFALERTAAERCSGPRAIHNFGFGSALFRLPPVQNGLGTHQWQWQCQSSRNYSTRSASGPPPETKRPTRARARRTFASTGPLPAAYTPSGSVPSPPAADLQAVIHAKLDHLTRRNGSQDLKEELNEVGMLVDALVEQRNKNEAWLEEQIKRTEQSARKLEDLQQDRIDDLKRGLVQAQKNENALRNALWSEQGKLHARFIFEQFETGLKLLIPPQEGEDRRAYFVRLFSKHLDVTFEGKSVREIRDHLAACRKRKSWNPSNDAASALSSTYRRLSDLDHKSKPGVNGVPLDKKLLGPQIFCTMRYLVSLFDLGVILFDGRHGSDGDIGSGYSPIPGGLEKE